MAKELTLEDESPRSIGVQYATGEEQRNSFRKNEESRPKQERHLAVAVSGSESDAIRNNIA